jgi:hypothetical protein
MAFALQKANANAIKDFMEKTVLWQCLSSQIYSKTSKT